MNRTGYLKSKIVDMLVYVLGLCAAIFIIYNSCDSVGIDSYGFIPGIFCAAAIIHAIIFRMKLF